MCVHACVCACVCVCMRVYVCMCVSARVRAARVCMCVSVCVYMFWEVFMCRRVGGRLQLVNGSVGRLHTHSFRYFIHLLVSVNTLVPA